MIFKKIFSSKQSKTGFWITVLIIAASLSSGFLSRYDPLEVNIEEAYKSPSLAHPFGTDSLGRDLFSRILHGGKVSLSVGFFAVGIATFIGLVLGSLAGFYGGFTDTVICRFIDIVLSFPTIFLILGLSAIFEPSLNIIIIIIGVSIWPSTARLIRAEILALKEKEFVVAALLLGTPQWKVIIRHLIPNALGPVLVNATLNVAACIMIEAGLSFLGLGVQPPVPSWGNILMEAKQDLGFAWWIMFFPGLFIFITVLSINFIGDALRERY